MNEHETIKFVCTDPAGTCHVCGKDGAAGERWVNADTCDVCSYLQSSIKWGGSMALAVVRLAAFAVIPVGVHAFGAEVRK